MKISKGEKAFYIINEALLILITICILYPLIYVVSASFSSPLAVDKGDVILLPKDFTVAAYNHILSMRDVWMAYGNSFFYTIAGTAVSMFVTILGAYPLSRDKLPGLKLINILVAVSLWFGAGMIPAYLNFRDLGLLNSRMAILIGFACTPFNLILMRNFFKGIPRSLEEAAAIDGAGSFRILAQIVIPLSAPAIATIALFYAVEKWNTYMWPMILLNDDSKIPLQVFIKKLIVELKVPEFQQASVDMTAFDEVGEQTFVYASIVVSALPMLVLYPFVQRYFVKGVMVGAVKG